MMTRRATQSRLAAEEVAAFTVAASRRNHQAVDLARSQREVHFSPLALAYRPSRGCTSPASPAENRRVREAGG
jgi:hypothetical protein